MSLISSILLGLVQGLAEFLPISSSGHLAIAAHFMGQAGIGEPPPFFDVLLHLGTLAAVFAAYWQDIREMIAELICGVRDLARGTTPTPIPPARRLILLIIVGTLPLFVVLPVKDFIEGLGDNIYFVAGALIVTGFLLFASDRVKKGRKTEKTATLLDVLLVGVAQAIATCPGISRSGTTITAGCFVGLDRRFAVRYSFLMSIPAILGANHPDAQGRHRGEDHHRLGHPGVSGGRGGGRRGGVPVHPPAEDDRRQGPLRLVRLLLLGGGRDRAGPGAGAGLSGPWAPQRGAAASAAYKRFRPRRKPWSGRAPPDRSGEIAGPPQDRRSCGAAASAGSPITAGRRA